MTGVSATAVETLHEKPYPNKVSERGGKFAEYKVDLTASVTTPISTLDDTESSSALSSPSSTLPEIGLDEHRRSLAVKTINLRVPSEDKVGSDMDVSEVVVAKRSEILATFDAHFSLYESLFSILTDEAYYVRADRLRHPLIFYLGHTAAFYVNKMVLMGIIKEEERINPEIEELVAVGVDEMSWDDLLPVGYPWPPVAKMYEFRNQVRSLVTDVVTNRIKLSPGDLIDWDHPFWAIIMGIEHERIHLETSAVLIRQIPLKILNSKASDDVWNAFYPSWRSDVSKVPKNSFVPISGGEVVLGRSWGKYKFPEVDAKVGTSSVYGWDNEYGRHVGHVDSFHVSKQLVSNADWLEFVNDGGYEKKQYWSEEGWGWVTFIKPKHALFWVPDNKGSYVLRNLVSETETMPWDWPVEVNCLEANAYCRWYSDKSGKYTRLPTEDEWNQTMLAHSPYVTAGGNDPDEFLPSGNLGLRYASSSPVDAHPTGDLYDVCGNVWQWCKTPTYPFEGFEVHRIYLDFTTPTYDDKHNMIKGGSWVTTGNEATRFARYAFRRHFFQFAGLRLVQTGETFPPESPAGKGFFEPEYEPKNDLTITSWKTYDLNN